MKTLFQSKKFKRNFKKWLCMYVGALLLLTTVVTYSKFISSFGGSDSARVTKFDVTINKPETLKNCKNDGTSEEICCNGSLLEENISCKTGTYRPTTEVSYDFIVNTNFEVNTILAVSVYVPLDYTIIKLEEINGTVLYDSSDASTVNYPSIPKLDEKNNQYQLITISKDIKAIAKNSDSNQSQSYKITLKYNYSYKDNIEISNKSNKEEVIKIGYSATQDKI